MNFSTMHVKYKTKYWHLTTAVHIFVLEWVGVVHISDKKLFYNQKLENNFNSI